MVAAGAEHTVAITASGKLYGWGWGRYGNLGLGDCKDRSVPAEVATLNVCPHCTLFMLLSTAPGFAVLRLKEAEFILQLLFFITIGLSN